jgi:hypothetical protein
LKLPDHLADSGKKVKCPKCQTAISTNRPQTQPKEATAPVQEVRKKTVPAKSSPPPADSPEEQNRTAEPPRPRKKTASNAPGVLTHNTWLLKKEERIIFPTLYPYRLDLLETDGKTPLGYIVESTNRWFKMFLASTRLGRFFPINLAVCENNGAPAPFRIRIPGLRFNPLALLGIKERRIEILNEEGELTCSFVMKLLSLTPSFHVYDGDERKIADFKFRTMDMKKMLPPRMILLSLEGEEWGTVAGENEAAITEKIKAGQKTVVTVAVFKKYGLLIKVNPGAGDQLINKQMIIAAAVAMRLFGAHKIFDNT